jgi:hypothetical protein
MRMDGVMLLWFVLTALSVAFVAITGRSLGRSLIRGARHGCCSHANFREPSLKAFFHARTREELTAKTLHGCHTGIPKRPQ